MAKRGSVAGVLPAVAVAAATLMPRPIHKRRTAARNHARNHLMKEPFSISLLLGFSISV
jgi:hypothetical protein